MSSLSVLCYINENNGFPPWLLSIVQQHFIVVSDAEFNANEAKFADDIVAIFNFHGKPKVGNYINVDLLIWLFCLH